MPLYIVVVKSVFDFRHYAENVLSNLKKQGQNRKFGLFPPTFCLGLPSWGRKETAQILSAPSTIPQDIVYRFGARIKYGHFYRKTSHHINRHNRHSDRIARHRKRRDRRRNHQKTIQW